MYIMRYSSVSTELWYTVYLQSHLIMWRHVIYQISLRNFDIINVDLYIVIPIFDIEVNPRPSLKVFDTRRPRTPLLCLSFCLPVFLLFCQAYICKIRGADEQQKLSLVPRTLHVFNSTYERFYKRKNLPCTNLKILNKITAHKYTVKEK